MRHFSPIKLGGTLYVPSTHKNILQIANGVKYPALKSVVFCLEDAINEESLHVAMDNIQKLLNNFVRQNLKIFIRPRNIDNLIQLLRLENIDKIDGFALAKFSHSNMREYFKTLNTTCRAFHIMPVLESRDIFDIELLKKIRDFLLQQKDHNVISVRIGGEDMFKMIGIKKDCATSIHETHIGAKVIGDVLSIFKPYGFNVSSPVYNCLKDLKFFEQELNRDIKEGLFGKTLIHPSQIEVTNRVYKVYKDELDEAQTILKNNDAIFRYEDKMIERSVHSAWAENIVKRSKVYGVKLSI